MTVLPGRLGELRACDVMTKSVIVVRENDLVSAAVETLRSQRITGTPVIDEKGRLVGILSMSDVVDVSKPPGTGDAASAPLSHAVDRTAWDLFERGVSIGEEHGDLMVRDRMSRQVRSVKQDATLVDVARAMCDGHWHRVPVIDENGSLQGIISTMDVLAAVVNVADESQG